MSDAITPKIVSSSKVANDTNILLLVTGSVGAALVVPRFILMARARFSWNIQVVLSQSATRFITPYTATLFSGQTVITDMFSTEAMLVPHIDLARVANLILVMPATANTIAKAAYGIGDNLVTTVLLGAQCPIVFAPNMNEAMWRRSTTQESIERLKRDGHHVIQPVRGLEISTLQETYGVMPSVESILKELLRVMKSHRETTRSG